MLEEMVFRAIGLGGLLGAWALSEPIAASICAVAFGLSHWYFGWLRVILKILVGVVFTTVALSAGWVAAALAHLMVNIVLTAIDQHQTQPAS